jgi:hypothetical protein
MNKYICILISILCPFYNVSAQEIAQKYCETDGIVNSTLKLNNKIYIGGNFSYVGKTTGAFGAYEIANPNNILLPIAIDGNIQTIAKDASGKIYIGGDFMYQGVQKYLLILNPDYSVATSPAIVVNGQINKLIIDGSNLVFSGDFTSVNSQTRLGMAAYNLATNSIYSFSPNSDGPIYDFTVVGSNIYMGGAFSYIGGGLRSSFASMSLNNNLNNINLPVVGRVNSIEVIDSLLFLGGEFDSISGLERKNLASINLTTQQIRTWNVYTDAPINSMKIVYPNLHLGGSFFSINTNTSRAGYAIVDVFSGSVSNIDLAFDAPIEKIEVTNGQIFAFGNFTTIGSTNKKNYVVLTPGGSIVSSPNINNRANTSLVIGSHIFIGGQFSSMGGSLLNNLAALDNQTGDIINWSPNINGEVRFLSKVGSEIIVAGDFNTINSISRVGIAIIDTLNGTPNATDFACNGTIYKAELLGSNLYLAGEFTELGDSLRNNLASYNMNSHLVNAWNPNVNGLVNQMLIREPFIFISGNFSEVSGLPKKFIASFNLATSGSLRAWNIDLDSNVTSLTSSGNQILITGIFNTVNSNYRAPAIFADTSSAIVSNWAPQFTGYPNTAFVDNNLVLLGGSINTNNNQGLLAFNFNNGLELDFPVKIREGSLNHIGRFEDKISLGGDYTLANSYGKRNFAIINYDVNTPTIQASQVSFTAISPISARVHIVKGNGAKRLILVKIGSAVDSVPSNGSSYAANSSFGSGDFIGTNNVAYIGSDTTFELTNLNNTTNYHVAVFEFNGFSSYTKYLGIPARGNFTTSAAFTPPTTSATNLSFTDVRVNSAKIKWTKGNGEKRIVVLRENASVNQTPTDSTEYFGNSEMGAGSDLGSSNFVVYNGDGDSCVITNLKSNKTYYASIFEYNGPAQLSRFKFSTPALGSATTLSMASMPTIPASNLNVTYTTSEEISLSWTNGGGTSRIVIASNSQAVSTMPNEGELYFSDNYFNGNSSYLSENERVVYVGSGNSVIVKGLNQMTNYHFTVIEYNGGQFTSSYLTLGRPTTNATTKSSVSSPITPSRNITFTSKGTDYISLQWQKGSGEKRLIVIKNKLNSGALPIQGNYYNANTVFGSGDSLDDGAFVIGNEDIDSLTVTGLEANTTYYFAIFEFNESSFGGIYLTDSFAYSNTKTDPSVGLKKNIGQGFKIFPNPVMDGIVQIETTHALNGNEKIEIKDINGKIVYDLNANNWIQNSSNKLSLNLGDSLRGIFFITLTNDKGIFSTKLTLN